MKKSDLIITIGFATFIGSFFFLHLYTPDVQFSQNENRNLQLLPSFTFTDLKNGSYSSKLEDYTVDQFPYRDFFVGLKATSEWSLGKLENNNVYWTKEGVLIDRFYPVDYKQLDTNLDKVMAFSQKVDVPVAFTVVPTQNDIYAYHLNENTPLVSQKNVLDYVADYTHTSDGLISDTTWTPLNNENEGAYGSFQYIDIYSNLMAHNKEYIYYNTDHHWTTLGAFYGYQTIAANLGHTTREVHEYSETIVVEDFLGTTHSKASLPWAKKDVISTFVPNQGITYTNTTGVQSGYLYEDLDDHVKNQYEVFMAGNQPLVVIENKDHNTEKLLIIRDSYSNNMAPFFIEHYGEIHMVDMRTYKESMSEYIAEHGITQVLICYGVSNFCTDTNLIFLR